MAALGIHEARLYDPLETFLLTQGFDIFRQVRMMGRQVDLVATAPGGSEVMAFELKVSHWQRALRQAYLNMFFSSHSYIAVPLTVAERAQALIPVGCGIGLIGIGETCTVVSPAAFSSFYDSSYVAQLLKALSERSKHE